MQAGKFDQAIAEELRAQDVDPLAAHLRGTTGHVFYEARRFDLAIQQYRRAMELDPNVRFCHQIIGWAYARRGMHEEAIREWFQFHEGFYNSKAWAILTDAYRSSGYEGYLRAQVGKQFANAIRPRALSNYERAVVYSELDDHDRALNSLVKAVRNQENDLVELAVDPDLEKLHSDRRFQALVQDCRAHCGEVRPF
jgi:tetratricopeptide (TPR) repeat protein